MEVLRPGALTDVQGAAPSEFMTNTSRFPPALGPFTKAILDPSGDHRYHRSVILSSVIRLSPVPSDWIAERSTEPSRVLRNAISSWLPSEGSVVVKSQLKTMTGMSPSSHRMLL